MQCNCPRGEEGQAGVEGHSVILPCVEDVLKARTAVLEDAPEHYDTLQCSLGISLQPAGQL